MALIARALLREFRRERALQHRGLGVRQSDHQQPQRSARSLPRGRRDEDGLYLFGRIQRGRERDACDKRLLVVIMGAPSTNERNLKAVSLFERFFGSPGSGLGSLEDLRSSDIVAAPDLRGQICGPGRRNAIMEAEAEDASISLAPAASAVVGKAAERADVLGTATASAVASAGPAALLHARDPVTPVRVFIGPAPKARPWPPSVRWVPLRPPLPDPVRRLQGTRHRCAGRRRVARMPDLTGATGDRPGLDGPRWRSRAPCRRRQHSRPPTAPSRARDA